MFTLDTRINGTKVKNALILPGTEMVCMSMSLFNSKFRAHAGPPRVLKKNRQVRMPIPGYQEEFLVRDIFNAQISWGQSESEGSDAEIFIINNCPHHLILPGSLHPSFFNIDSLLYQYEENIFHRQRTKSKRPENLSQQCMGIVILKKSVVLTKFHKFEYRNSPYEQPDFLSTLGTLVCRFYMAMKKIALYAKLQDSYFSICQGLIEPMAKDLRALFDFILNSWRVTTYLPKGTKHRRVRCNCRESTTGVLSLLFDDEPLERRRYDRPHWFASMVLERKPGHFHICSSIECRKVLTGTLRVCALCKAQNLQLRHFYCSKNCQEKEWEFSHQLYHHLIAETWKL